MSELKIENSMASWREQIGIRLFIVGVSVGASAVFGLTYESMDEENYPPKVMEYCEERFRSTEQISSCAQELSKEAFIDKETIHKILMFSGAASLALTGVGFYLLAETSAHREE